MIRYAIYTPSGCHESIIRRQRYAFRMAEDLSKQIPGAVTVLRYDRGADPFLRPAYQETIATFIAGKRA